MPWYDSAFGFPLWLWAVGVGIVLTIIVWGGLRGYEPSRVLRMLFLVAVIVVAVYFVGTWLAGEAGYRGLPRPP